MDYNMKNETVEAVERSPQRNHVVGGEVIVLSSSSSGSSSSSSFSFGGSDNGDSVNPTKKRRVESILPIGFLDPIRPPGFQRPMTNGSGSAASNSIVRVKEESVQKVIAAAAGRKEAAVSTVSVVPTCKQFWKAGDYEGVGDGGKIYDDEMDRVRVHPKFLHSNATSHKWSLGAFAELLDNALDESCNGATYVNVDVLNNAKDNSKMVLVQDNGGGMSPEKMHQCMSLGYSAKSKMANMIGQYGNGFKTSTMRLGADVIVFSRCKAKYGGRSTQSIGLLSFTFLRSTGKEDIVVPMIHYEAVENYWSKCSTNSSKDNWQLNLETILQWSPYKSEDDLLKQFDTLGQKGTRIIIYNLWDNDEGRLELDFESDEHDIQLRGADRDEKKIDIANKFASSRIFLTYRHSLRSYASILYRKVPSDFQIILRGKVVDHHDMVNDMKFIERNVYKPMAHPDMASKDQNISTTVILGFVKDADHHFDIQGFNVYHKNRLIKPFWRVWNASGSDGRGVIGILEANFIEPAHDKQGFERTVPLSRLENRLMNYQKIYWSTNCQLIGYAQRRGFKKSPPPDKTNVRAKTTPSSSKSNGRPLKSCTRENAAIPETSQAHPLSYVAPADYDGDDISTPQSSKAAAANVHVKTQRSDGVETNISFPSISSMVKKLKEENDSLRNNLQYEKDRYNSLQNEHERTKMMMATMDEQQERFVTSFLEERERRVAEEEKLRTRLREASDTIQALLDKVKMLEARKK